jgi:hypothetical protein
MTAITAFVGLDRRGRVAVLTVNNPPFNSSSRVLLCQGMHTIDCHHE